MGDGGTGAAPPRVVLVEDDASIRRLVALALEDLPVDLVPCADAAQARQALHDAPAALLLTDLMMPGESGLALLQALAADPALRGPARLAVFSAGVDQPTRAALDALGVWRVLHKPASMAGLQDFITQSLQAQPAPTGALPVPEPAPASDDDEAAAITLHFGGDAALFRAYRQSCLAQFTEDIAVGDAALASGDLGALRRLGHSLKSVLLTLGHATPARQAQALDAAAAAGEAQGSATHWQALRETLLRIQFSA